jgi:formate dehydrogenase major subunit
MAECHPVGFQWVMEAKKRGATVLHIDPRFTRTSAHADQHVPIRAGSDIVFLGALIKYVLDNEKYFKEYVVAYTNAATLVGEAFQDVDEHDGLFSGYDPETGTYDTKSWAYAGHADDGSDDESEGSQKERAAGQELGGRGRQPRVGGGPARRDAAAPADGVPGPQAALRALHARAGAGGLRRAAGGVPEGGRGDHEQQRTRAHHRVGLLRGLDAALGRRAVHPRRRDPAAAARQHGPSGGRHHGAARARQHPGLDRHPDAVQPAAGYLPMPKAGVHDDFADYLDGIRNPDQKGFWTKADAYTVSLLKAWFGEAATAENGFRFDYLPRLTGDHGTYRTVMDMVDGKVEGYFLVGQNPAVGSAHGKLQRLAMAKLKWLVVRDVNMIESATFWKDGPEIETGELRTEDIDTEVFFLPAATHVEKAGTFTQTQRMVQWRHKAVDPPGDCRPELDFYFRLGQLVRERLKDSTLERDRPLLDLTWDYEVDEHGEPLAESVLAEINGRYLTGPRAGQPLDGFTDMRADGSTDGGCWIYAGIYKDGVNQAARRKPGREQDWVASQWGWAWPMDRRTLYNRASADPAGKPWSERKAYVWWDEQSQRWTGHDVPDFIVDRPPTYRPEPGATGPDALAGDDPFVMQGDGKGWLYAAGGLLDGPLPPTTSRTSRRW